ncbi:hypothetical protein CRI93_02175 [Longimonas halophila]|uniref:Late embryogenesis abundant protein LEA-2 subgroup domain-containing protein n=2 Tax=Longimonas halophila TaxID=1469170 RepID=A0A2H3NQK1_9BACT|nr:hypothetical protein CRI93_02175 [Longimonas halophila]
MPYLFLVLVSLTLTSCQTLREVGQLRNVDFRLDRVTNAQLAGVNLSQLERPEDLGPVDLLNIGNAVRRGEVPLSFSVIIEGTNPADNSMSARMTALDWTLLLNERETISGAFAEETVLEPGVPTDIRFPVELNLVEFFDGGARDLVNLALSLAGDGPPTNVQFQAEPTIRTPLGPMRYGEPITIVHRTVGNDAAQ